jgi:hypothetical protein
MRAHSRDAAALDSTLDAELRMLEQQLPRADDVS